MQCKLLKVEIKKNLLGIELWKSENEIYMKEKDAWKSGIREGWWLQNFKFWKLFSKWREGGEVYKIGEF